jgi:hypothetical protein
MNRVPKQGFERLKEQNRLFEARREQRKKQKQASFPMMLTQPYYPTQVPSFPMMLAIPFHPIPAHVAPEPAPEAVAAAPEAAAEAPEAAAEAPEAVAEAVAAPEAVAAAPEAVAAAPEVLNNFTTFEVRTLEQAWALEQARTLAEARAHEQKLAKARKTVLEYRKVDRQLESLEKKKKSMLYDVQEAWATLREEEMRHAPKRPSTPPDLEASEIMVVSLLAQGLDSGSSSG